MTSTQLQTLLQDLYRDKVALRDRHVEGARHVSSYEFNNTYQYVINREDLHLSWVRNALADEGIAEPAAPAATSLISCLCSSVVIMKFWPGGILC